MEQVKKGYKITKVGCIPFDWMYDNLDIHSQRGSGHTPNKKIKEYYEGEIVWISLADSDRLDKGKIDSSTITISQKGIANSSAVLHPKGVVLMSRDAGIGKSAVADCPLCVSQHFITWLCNERTLHNWFLYYWLQYQKSEFERIAIGSTIKTIGLPYFKKYKVPLPNYNEQKAIAKALSDVDELITKLEKLIAKKKSIMQGVMQQLLTPKQNWKTKKLKELATYRRGSFPQPYGLAKWYDDISGTPFVQVVDVDDNKKMKKETKARISKEAQKYSVFVPQGSIILTIQGSIGRICITDYDAYVDRTLLIFESFLETFNKYFFMMSVFLKFEIEKEKAPGGIIKTITKEALSSFTISYPELEEQNKIAEILQSMNAEINLQEKKLYKKQLIKQGIMQELLTGKTRLI